MNITAAAIQFNVKQGDVDANLAHVRAALKRVAGQGANLAVLPEMWSTGFAYRNLNELALRSAGIIEELLELSRDLKLVIVGSMPEPNGAKVFNTVSVIDNGRVAGTYRKMHLFSLLGEDRAFDSGDTWLLAETSLGPLGVIICYDLRFPELFRAMGPLDLIVLPAAFTDTTGKAHWEILLRARAVENQCYLLASAQGGRHPGGRMTHGNSMIIDPWGKILARIDKGEGVIVAAVDAARIDDVRASLPALKHRKL